ncbi:unnamed protein product [Amoebophrya sp. A120]|nr:unnamed protein product [Amoebophrya sp. A120]|eukprot:GSA120T00003865001.1
MPVAELQNEFAHALTLDLATINEDDAQDATDTTAGATSTAHAYLVGAPATDEESGLTDSASFADDALASARPRGDCSAPAVDTVTGLTKSGRCHRIDLIEYNLQQNNYNMGRAFRGGTEFGPRLPAGYDSIGRSAELSSFGLMQPWDVEQGTVLAENGLLQPGLQETHWPSVDTNVEGESSSAFPPPLADGAVFNLNPAQESKAVPLTTESRTVFWFHQYTGGFSLVRDERVSAEESINIQCVPPPVGAPNECLRYEYFPPSGPSFPLRLVQHLGYWSEKSSASRTYTKCRLAHQACLDARLIDRKFLWEEAESYARRIGYADLVAEEPIWPWSQLLASVVVESAGSSDEEATKARAAWDRLLDAYCTAGVEKPCRSAGQRVLDEYPERYGTPFLETSRQKGFHLHLSVHDDFAPVPSTMAAMAYEDTITGASDEEGDSGTSDNVVTAPQVLQRQGNDIEMHNPEYWPQSVRMVDRESDLFKNSPYPTPGTSSTSDGPSGGVLVSNNVFSLAEYDPTLEEAWRTKTWPIWARDYKNYVPNPRTAAGLESAGQRTAGRRTTVRFGPIRISKHVHVFGDSTRPKTCRQVYKDFLRLQQNHLLNEPSASTTTSITSSTTTTSTTPLQEMETAAPGGGDNIVDVSDDVPTVPGSSNNGTTSDEEPSTTGPGEAATTSAGSTSSTTSTTSTSTRSSSTTGYPVPPTSTAAAPPSTVGSTMAPPRTPGSEDSGGGGGATAPPTTPTPKTSDDFPANPDATAPPNLFDSSSDDGTGETDTEIQQDGKPSSPRPEDHDQGEEEEKNKSNKERWKQVNANNALDASTDPGEAGQSSGSGKIFPPEDRPEQETALDIWGSPKPLKENLVSASCCGDEGEVAAERKKADVQEQPQVWGTPSEDDDGENKDGPTSTENTMCSDMCAGISISVAVVALLGLTFCAGWLANRNTGSAPAQTGAGMIRTNSTTPPPGGDSSVLVSSGPGMDLPTSALSYRSTRPTGVELHAEPLAAAGVGNSSGLTSFSEMLGPVLRTSQLYAVQDTQQFGPQDADEQGSTSVASEGKKKKKKEKNLLTTSDSDNSAVQKKSKKHRSNLTKDSTEMLAPKSSKEKLTTASMGSNRKTLPPVVRSSTNQQSYGASKSNTASSGQMAQALDQGLGSAAMLYTTNQYVNTGLHQGETDSALRYTDQLNTTIEIVGEDAKQKKKDKKEKKKRKSNKAEGEEDSEGLNALNMNLFHTVDDEKKKKKSKRQKSPQPE